MNEVKETFNTRVERLSNYLNRAYKHNKPSLLFALYVSEFLHTNIENYLNRLLTEQGLKVINIDAGKNKDLPSFFSSYNSHNTVFFVHNIEKGFPEVLQFLNFKREELIEHHVKVVFWIKEEELSIISIEAPDFFAFRNRVVEFMEIPLEREFRPAPVEFAIETEYKSIDEINRSIELKEKLLSELSTETEIYGYLLGSLGILYDQIGRYKISIDRSEKALAISKEIGDRRGEGSALGNLGNAFSNLGEVEKAIEYYEQAISIDKQVYGERHPNVARDLNNIGSAWNAMGDAKKAIEYYEQAISIDKQVYGETHPSVARDLNNIGLAWNAMGDAKKAIEYYEQAISIDKQVYGETHPDVARDLSNIGSAWYALGDAKKAIEYYEQALSIGKQVYGERHPRVATTLSNIGSAWKALGDAKKAIEYYEQAYDIFRNTVGDGHPHTKVVKQWLDAFGVK